MKVNPVPPVGDASAFMRQPAPDTPAMPSFDPTQADPAVSAAPAAYMSPLVSYDQVAQMVVIQIRDAASGEVTRQIPAQEVVERYRDQASGRTAPPETPPENTVAPAGTPGAEAPPQLQTTVAAAPDTVAVTQPGAAVRSTAAVPGEAG